MTMFTFTIKCGLWTEGFSIFYCIVYDVLQFECISVFKTEKGNERKSRRLSSFDVYKNARLLNKILKLFPP